MDTMSPDHDEAEFEDVIALLRHTYDVRAEDVEVLPDRPFRTAGHATRRPNWRVGLSVAAAALVVAGVVGVVALRDRGESGPGAETTTPTTSIADAETPATQLGADDVTWFLPALPDGYSLLEFGAVFRSVVPAGDPAAVCCGDHGSVAIALPDFSNRQRWVWPSNGGGATEMISAHAYFDPANELAQSSGEDIFDVTVHGVPGYVDTTTDPTITWLENGTSVVVRASIDLDADGSRCARRSQHRRTGHRLARLRIVACRLRTRRPARGRAAEIDRYQIVTGRLGSLDGSSGPISFRVVTALTALDVLIEEETERRVVDGVEYSLNEDEFGQPNVTVRWVTGGWEFEVTAAGGVDQAMDVATSLHEVTQQEAHAAVGAMADYVLTLPTLASAVLGDGTRVSVHVEDWQEANHAAICVEGPEPVCRRTRIPVEEDTSVIEVFEIGGDRRVLGWDRVVSEVNAGGMAAEVVPATSGTGTFVSVPIEPGAAIPQVMWTNERGTLTGYLPDLWLQP